MTASIAVAKSRDYLLKDYYHNDLEKPGVWTASGAKALGLEGEVTREDMHKIWDGFSPDGKRLVQNAGSENRQFGWDVTFSAPKSFSVAWGIANDDLKAQLEAAHHRAVLDGLQYIEDTAAFSRVGKGGIQQERVGLVTASFQHGTSRENEPQLHTHNLNFNLGVRENGKTNAIESYPMYCSKMAAGAAYRARLATESQRLGFEIERTEKGNFELKGISRELQAEFSSRSTQIQDYLKEHGLEENAKNRALAAVETRTEKINVPEDELRGTWRDIAAEHGVTPEHLREIQTKSQELSELDIRRNQNQVLEDALEKCLYHDSVFTERAFDRAMAEQSIGKGLVYSDMKAIKERWLGSRDAVELEQEGRNRVFTSMRQLDLEAELHDCTMSRSKDTAHTVKTKHLFATIQQRPTMSAEQKQALRHVTSTGGVKVVSGMAGTGKSFMLDGAREVWEKSGYEVQGLALSGKAASELQDSAGIQSRTLDSFFASLDYNREQNGGEQSLISNNTVFVVDEAGMVDTKRLTSLFQEADLVGSKVVLVGDARQLQSVQSGGAFQTISRQVGEVELKEIRRQTDVWAQQTVHDFADGKAKKALDELDTRGQLVIEADKKTLREGLISDWAKAGGETNAKDHLILAQTNEEVKELNRLAQQKRKEAGELGETYGYIGKTKFFEGDRVLFRKNENQQLQVKNGQMGYVQGIDNIRQVFTVALDNGREVTFSPDDYSSVSLGYATTVHKSQGMTVENSFVMTGGNWDRHLAYVAGSRAREETRLYVQGETEQREEVKQKLSEKLSRDNQKQLASDRMPEVRRMREPMRVGQEV